jgi:5,6-dimethylbenzimidazole synthase
MTPEFDAAFRDRLETLFRWRRDVRRFAPTPLAESDIEELLALAALAPSVGLSQPWRFVRVDDPVRRARVAANFRAANAEALGGYAGERAARYATLKLAGLDDAPVHLAACVDLDPVAGAGLGRRTMPETLAFSVVTAVFTFWLAARSRGIGVGWVSILDPVAVLQDLDVPASWSLVAYLCVGYPQEEHDDPELQRAGWERRADPSSFVVRR